MTPIHIAMAAAIASLTLFACQVEKEQEGEMPDVDVSADAGRLPAYDIDAPDVEVGTRTETVKVPKVKIVVEEEEIRVPYIDIDPAGADAERDDRIGTTASAERPGTSSAVDRATPSTAAADVPAGGPRDQTLTVVLDVPDEQYDVEIEEIYLVSDELWVISRLESSTARPGTARSGKRASDTVVVRTPEDLEVTHYIIGQRVEGNPAYRFIDSRSEIEPQLRSARRVYQADPTSAQQLSSVGQP